MANRNEAQAGRYESKKDLVTPEEYEKSRWKRYRRYGLGFLACLVLPPLIFLGAGHLFLNLSHLELIEVWLLSLSSLLLISGATSVIAFRRPTWKVSGADLETPARTFAATSPGLFLVGSGFLLALCVLFAPRSKPKEKSYQSPPNLENSVEPHSDSDSQKGELSISVEPGATTLTDDAKKKLKELCWDLAEKGVGKLYFSAYSDLGTPSEDARKIAAHRAIRTEKAIKEHCYGIEIKATSYPEPRPGIISRQEQIKFHWTPADGE